MNKTENTMIRPDAKGRINLGDFAKGVSSYKINCASNGELTLIPYTEIPFVDKWIFDDEELLEKVKQQLMTETTDSLLLKAS
jgi:hypothetical protein